MNFIAIRFILTSSENIRGMFCLLLIGVVLTGCHSEWIDNRAEIKGNIQFPISDKIYFYTYPDTVNLCLNNMSAMDSSLIDKNGNYSFSIPCEKPYSFNLVSGSDILVPNLFLIPGDKIQLNFIGKNNRPEIFPSGEGAKHNAFLIKFLVAFYKDSATKHEYYIASNYMDIDQFTSYNESRKQKQLDLFNDFFKYDSLEKEFRDYALNTIHYGIAVDRLMYLWKKRMKGENVVADSSYFSFETASFIENKDAFSCPTYIHFLNLYIKDTYERMVERGELTNEISGKFIPQVEKYKLAMRLLNQPYRDAVLYNIVMDDFKDVAEKNTLTGSAQTSLDSLIISFKKKYSLK